MIILNRGAPRKLLFAAYPLGYGPAAKALAIAERCREAGLESVFVGRGVAHELVARSAGPFIEAIEANGHDRELRAMVRDAGAIVSVMDRDIARLAGEASRPLHVVDSLMWMRDRVPGAFSAARRYWMQRLWDDEPTAPPHIGFTFVGPILRPRPSPSPPGQGLLVSLGGFEANAGSERDHRYAQLILSGIHSSHATRIYPSRVKILASARLAKAIEAQAHRLGVQTASLAHSEALEELGSASVILTAPGLTTSLECFQLGRPTFFLPPRNYSQWCTLKKLRARGLAPYALHWEDLGERFRLAQRMPEEVRNPRVDAAITELAETRAAQDAIGRLFAVAASGGHGALVRSQGKFLQSLGDDGAQAIAAHLAGEAY